MRTASQIAAVTKIVMLNTGSWNPVKQNRQESAKVNGEHGTVNVAKVLVKLTDSPNLEGARSVARAAYKEHCRLTRSSIQNGVRILPNGREWDYKRVMDNYFSAWKEKVDAFIAEYDALRADAPRKLNGLYVPEQWPSVEAVRGKFVFCTRFLPCPAEGDWADWLMESANLAAEELREELKGAVRHVAERCRSEGKLYATVFDNLRELVSLVPDLNLTGDPEIAALAKACEGIACHSAEHLRDDDAGRANVASEAERLMSIFGAGALA